MQVFNNNRFFKAGILIVSVLLLTDRWIHFPDAFYCFSMGIGISLELCGIYMANHDMSKIRNFKLKWFKSRRQD